MSKTGILIINLGTPNAPTKAAVRRYLKQFLSDPYVVQIPKWIWWPLLNGVILPLRSKKSARLYKKIWTISGSPLLILSQKLATKIKDYLHNKEMIFPVELAMRYGEPSITSSLTKLQAAGVNQLIVLPLYPQYSKTTTASSLDEIKRQLNLRSWLPDLCFIESYFQNPTYINSLASSIEQFWKTSPPAQILLISFHGIPESSIKQGDPYYEQCLTTANLVAQKLALKQDTWRAVFQSRFGKARWLQPYCDATLINLASEGCLTVDIICPGFPVDCLETIEEIAMTNKRLFIEAGGKDYNFIPCLNDSDTQVAMLANLIIKEQKNSGR